MTSSVWTCEGTSAVLRVGELRARFDLCEPAAGLQQLEISGQSWSAAQLLGVELPAHDAAAAPPWDSYPRGADLVTTYPETAPRPFGTRIYWRAATAAPAMASIELIVTIETRAWDLHPHLDVSSRLPATAVCELTGLADGQFSALAPGEYLKAADEEVAVPCCRLFRFGQRWSYVELLHPDDARSAQCELHVPAAGEAAAATRYRLFSRPLERGVILQARLLAAVVPRAADTAAAAELWRMFSASQPVLTV